MSPATNSAPRLFYKMLQPTCFDILLKKKKKSRYSMHTYIHTLPYLTNLYLTIGSSPRILLVISYTRSQSVLAFEHLTIVHYYSSYESRNCTAEGAATCEKLLAHYDCFRATIDAPAHFDAALSRRINTTLERGKCKKE